MFRDDSRRAMERISFCTITALAATVFVSGCANFGAKKDGQTAKHWGEVRSQIKLQLARQQYEQGLVDEAIEFIQESLGWNANSGEAHLLLAKCYLEQNKISAAHRAAQKAADIMEESSELESIEGMVAERMGQYGLAVNHYHRARMIDDTVVEYLMSEAECLVSSGKPEQAQALLVSRVMDYGNDPSIHALLGEIALHIGDRESALESFSVALDAGRLDPVMTEEYALLAVEMKRYGEALAVFEPMLSNREKKASGSIIRASAKCMLELERMEEAKELLRDHLARDHDDLEAWYLLAKAGIVSGDLMTTRPKSDRCEATCPKFAADITVRRVCEPACGALQVCGGIAGDPC